MAKNRKKCRMYYRKNKGIVLRKARQLRLARKQSVAN